MIKNILISCLIIISFTNILMPMDIGAYLSPKLLFEIEDSGIKKENNKGNTQNLYAGGGIAFGYNFDIFHKYSTVRLEFEYLYRNPMPANVYIDTVRTMQSHSFLIGAYYDFNFWYINYNNNNSIRNEINRGKRQLMSIYAGFLMGIGINTFITKTAFEYNGLFVNNEYYNMIDFLYGPGIGLVFHITPLISLDFSYRILFNIKLQSNHDIAAAVRFNF